MDTSFNPGTGADDIVKAVVLQPDGRILLAGYFNQINGVARHGIARLQSNGAIDTSFDPGAGADNGISALVLQPDGKIVVGGEFTHYGGVARNRIARLDDAGKLDTSFNPGTGITGTDSPVVLGLALQNDGRVLAAGSFTNVNGVARNHLARLESNGAVDTGFDAHLTETTNKWLFLAQPLGNGQIMIGGVFTQVGGQFRSALARLNSDGSLDPSFDAHWDGFNFVQALAIRSDQKLITGGAFYSLMPTQYVSLVTFNTDGSLDQSFRPETDPDGQVNSIVIQPDSRVVVGGYFTHFAGVPRAGVVRLNNDGHLDTTFDPGSGTVGTNTHSGPITMALQSDNNLVIAGDFNRVNGTARNRIARLIGNVVTPLSITNQPGSQTVCLGSSVALNVGATGTGPINYQWRKDTQPIVGATDATYSIAAFDEARAGSYDAVVSGASGSILSSPAQLSFFAPLQITNQPLNQIVCPGEPVTFSVGASGNGRLSYHWRKDGQLIDGAVAATYQIAAAAPSDAGTYDAVITGPCGTTNSQPAVLVLHEPISISTPPASQIVHLGDSATLSVVASGTGVLQYSWRKSGQPLPGANSATLVVGPVTAADPAQYDVQVSGPCGTITSAPATLAVQLPGPFRLQAGRPLANGGALLTLLGETGWRYSFQYSPDLRTWTTWTNVLTVAPTATLNVPTGVKIAPLFFRATVP